MKRIARPSPSPLSRTRGFTLIELLVALTLLSLMMLAMASALRTTAQTEERVDQRMQRVDELRVASGFLRSVMGRISLQRRPPPLALEENPYFFAGGPQEMVWVGVMPARYGAGGRYFFRLGAESHASGRALVLRYLPWAQVDALPDWSNVPTYVLVPGITGFSLQYEDIMQEPPAWGAPWTNPERLPQRVSVTIQTATGPWPEIVVAMRPMPGSDPSSGGAVFGGSSE